jgi:hypothetical protein
MCEDIFLTLQFALHGAFLESLHEGCQVRVLIGKSLERNSLFQTIEQIRLQVIVVIRNASNARHTGGTVFTSFPPLVEAMGGATSSISPERDLLDLHGRVAIVTGAKYAMPGIGIVLFLR